MDLTAIGLTTGYGRTTICRDISLAVPAGRLVALVGRNGAGKTTLLRALGGELRAFRGAIKADETAITRWSTPERIRHGLVHVPQELALFPGMTVGDNLDLGAYQVRDRRTVGRVRRHVHDVFPRLAERRFQLAGTMSGGEQRQLAIARGLMAQPSVLLLDEPCTGLSPVMQDTLFEALRTVLADGIGILLAEQNLLRTAQEANVIVTIQRGEIAAMRSGARNDAGELVADAAAIAQELSQLETDTEAQVP